MGKEDYVSFEVAKLLKEKGFTQFCESYYSIYEPDDLRFKKIQNIENGDNKVAAPTLYEAQKWLRNKHDIAVNVCNRYRSKDFHRTVLSFVFPETKYQLWEYEYNKINECFGPFDRTTTFVMFNTYEEALNAGILEALKLI